MEVKIDKESKEFTVTAKTDFYRFLDENFTEICIAIERKGKILKELANMVEKDANAMDKYQKNNVVNTKSNEGINRTPETIRIKQRCNTISCSGAI